MLKDVEEYLYLWNVYQKCVYPAGNIIRFFLPHLSLPHASLYQGLEMYTKSFFPMTLYFGSRLLQNKVKHQMSDQKNTTRLFLMTVIQS